jgi:hypothetical protein
MPSGRRSRQFAIFVRICRSLFAENVANLAMTNSFGGSISRRGPCIVTEEIAVALSGPLSFEFKPLFEIVHANLRARKSASGGEEMLRLRTYEKLQSLVSQGMVRKTITKAGKKYQGLASLSTLLPRVPGEPAVTP